VKPLLSPVLKSLELSVWGPSRLTSINRDGQEGFPASLNAAKDPGAAVSLHWVEKADVVGCSIRCVESVGSACAAEGSR
jgi:hypothetical protein